MGTGSVALDVVYQNLAKGKLEAGTQVLVQPAQALLALRIHLPSRHNAYHYM